MSLCKAIYKVGRQIRSLIEGYHFSKKYQDIPRKMVMTPHNFLFTGHLSMMNGTFEVDEVACFKNTISDTDIFLNIGANIGYYTCLALKEGIKSIAFEPNPINGDFLCRNIYANQWQEKIEFYPMALSNTTGLFNLYGEGTGASLIKGWAGTSENKGTIVPVTTIDLVISNRFEGKKVVVLMDVEGVELMVLKGASKLITQNPKPKFIIEIAIDEHQPDGQQINPNLLETFDIFWKNGYHAYTFDKKMREITEKELKLIMTTKVNSIETHNFIFQ